MASPDEKSFVDVDDVENVMTSTNRALATLLDKTAHDLSNPISIIDGHTRLLKRFVGQDEVDVQMSIQSIEKIQNGVEKMTLIINNLRKWVRAQNKKAD